MKTIAQKIGGTTVITHDFGVVDSKCRKVGAQVSMQSYEFVQATDEQVKAGIGYHDMEPGVYCSFCPHALRDGKPFGALQTRRYFNSEYAMASAVAKYFADAKKRASKV